MDKLFIVKIGGNVLDDPDSLTLFLRDFAAIGAAKLLIHGGGKIATNLGNQLGIQSNYVRGRRITDTQTLDLVTMVYGGLVNKQLVARLQAEGCNAFGVTGADGNLISAVKRPVSDIDYGYVGDVAAENVNTPLLRTMLEQNTVPVFASLTHADGKLLNTNADTIASVLAMALSTFFDVRLIFCFDKKGVLENVGDDESVIRHVSRKSYEDLLRRGVLADGILPKLENAFAAIYAGVREVLIGQASDLTRNTGKDTAGTLITL
jgi:acetylglutamate kinase